MAVCICYFIKVRTGFSFPSLSAAKTAATSILRIALSPFGLTFSPNIILILMNKFAMLYGGEDAVACYAAIAYITMIIVFAAGRWRRLPAFDQPLLWAKAFAEVGRDQAIGLCHGRGHRPRLHDSALRRPP